MMYSTQTKSMVLLKTSLIIAFIAVSMLAAKAITPEMTLVNGGTFKMGNQFEDMFEDELPVHNVTLSDYYIATYELTQGEWNDVMDKNPSQFKGEENLPVEKVSWYDAIEFCNKLSVKEGLKPCYTFGRNQSVTWDKNASGYRLPTEAEWEFAARGGLKSRGYVYAGSNNSDEVAWYKENSTGHSHLTGTKLANEIGLYDMSGNVWEWCWDWYSNSYNDVKGLNPDGVVIGTERCRRGGAWHIIAKSCRTANRLGTPPQMSFDYVGFRVARNAK